MTDFRKIGRYRLRDEIPRSGIGQAFLSTDPDLGTDVFLKVLPKSWLPGSTFRTELEQEARVIALLGLPGIVPIDVIEEQEEIIYIASRFLHGGSLEDRLREGLVAPQQAAGILDRLAPALDGVHATGILHRRLKPANLVFDRSGIPHLTDFGMYKLIDREGTGRLHILDPAITYLSPEQVWGVAELDWRSDLYSLGALLFHMLTGRPPFKAERLIEVAEKRLTEGVPIRLLEQVQLGTATMEVLSRALAASPAMRYASARQLAAAFRASLSGRLLSGSEVLEPDTPPAFRAPPLSPPGEARPDSREAEPEAGGRRAISWGWILFLPILLVLGLGALYLTTGPQTKISLPWPRPVPSRTQLPASTPSPVPPSPAVDTPPPVETRSPGGQFAPETTQTPAIRATMEITSAPVQRTSPSPTAIVIGGADRLAFLRENDIYLSNLNGTNILALTDDGEPKLDLNWTPDGKALTYISAGQVRMLDIESGNIRTLGDYEEFQIAPDMQTVVLGKTVANPNRVLHFRNFVAPFDPNTLLNLTTRFETSCPFPGRRLYQFSPDGQRVAAVMKTSSGGQQVDSIQVFDWNNCESPPDPIDEFPGKRFFLRGYSEPDTPARIVSYSWNGASLFALNGDVLNGFGDLIIYNMDSKRDEVVNPLPGSCCYGDLQWSPDGEYLLFAFQDVKRANRTLLYYVQFGTIGTGQLYEPIPLPFFYFQDPQAPIDPRLRPVVD